MSRKTPGYPPQRWITQFLIILLVSVCGVIAGCGDDNKKSRSPVPVLTTVSPTATAAGGAGFTLTVTGTGFISGSVVHWNGTARATTFGSSTQLTAAILASDLVSTGTAQVTVVNPTPGGGTSSAVTFTIQNPVPVAASLSPPSVLAGTGAFPLTVNGSGFVSGAIVRWNDAPRTTTFVSSTVLRAAINAADVASAGTAQVTVFSPAPGGGASAALTFTIQSVAPVPIISALNPAGVVAGAPAFDLAVSGTGFVQGATVLWDDSARVTTFVSATQLRAAITAADVASAGYHAVTVRNPTPGGGTSNAVNFVVNPPPVTGGLVPITVGTDGSPPNGPSINGGLDYWGRYAIFASKASNLVPGDTNGAWDVFARDTCRDMWGDPVSGCVQSTKRISVAPDGAQANGDSGSTATNPERSLVVSYDGRYVAFVSSASNLVAGDTNGVDDVFVSDTCIEATATCVPHVERVSVRASGSQSSLPASAPAIGSRAGQVIFVSADPNMVAGDGNGVADVFMRETCFNEAGACTAATTRISVAAGGVDANAASGTPAFTGRYVAFTSAATNLVDGDTNGLVDVFMRDTCIGAAAGCTPSTERISVGDANVQADGASSEPLVGLPMSGMDGYDYHGRFVVFVSSASNLVAGDTNGVADVYMRDTCRGRPGCTPSTQRISLTSTGQQVVGASSLQPGHMRWDGEVVLFVTAANGVVPEDTNGVADVYVRSVCHDSTSCSATTRRLSVGEAGLQGNGASIAPRGNYDAWVGPEYVTFVSEATNFLTGTVPSPYYGSIFKTTAY